jgi:hypothetical protein
MAGANGDVRLPRFSSEAINWQPIGEIPLIAGMIDGALDDTRVHLATLTEARARPHLLDDDSIDRSERVHGEQLEFVDIYDEQIRRWRTQDPSAAQVRELDRLEQQNGFLRRVTLDVLALNKDLREGSIDRILEAGDLELGLNVLLGNLPPRRR